MKIYGASFLSNNNHKMSEYFYYIMKLTTHLHLILRLRMRGAVPPLSQYLFMVRYLIKQEICLHGMVLG